MGAEQSSPAAGRAASPARGRAASPGRPRRAPLSPTNKNATVVDVDSPPPRITKASVSEISGLSADASAAAAERVEARRAAEKARIKAERQGPSIRPHPNYQALRGLTSPGAKPLRADWDATSLRRDHAMSSPPPADAPRASGGGGVTPMRWNSVHARTSSPRQTPRPSPRQASPRSGREEADDRLAARRLLGHRVHQLVALRRQLTARSLVQYLSRWRAAALALSGHAAVDSLLGHRDALEARLAGYHERADGVAAQAAARAARVAILRSLAAALDHTSVVVWFARWQRGTLAVGAAEMAAAHAADLSDQEERRAQLSFRLSQRGDALASARKMIQRPTELERALAAATEEKAALEARAIGAEQKLAHATRRAEGAEARLRSQRPSPKPSPRPSAAAAGGGIGAGPAAFGRNASPRPASRASVLSSVESHELADEVASLRAALATAQAERQRAEAALNSGRVNAKTVADARKKARLARLASLLRMRWGRRVWPLLRRWHRVAVAVGHGVPSTRGRLLGAVRGAPLGDDVGLGEASELGLGEPPRERVLALQRELLELEARLDAAHGDARKARDSGKAAAAELASIKAQSATALAGVAAAARTATDCAAVVRSELEAEHAEAVAALRRRVSRAESAAEAAAAQADGARADAADARLRATTAEEALRDAREAAATQRTANAARDAEAREDSRSRAEASRALERKLRETEAALAESKERRPAQVQREVHALREELEATNAKLAEQTKRMESMNRRAAAAENRTETLQRELQGYRSGPNARLQRALQEPLHPTERMRFGRGADSPPPPAAADDASGLGPPPAWRAPRPFSPGPARAASPPPPRRSTGGRAFAALAGAGHDALRGTTPPRERDPE